MDAAFAFKSANGGILPGKDEWGYYSFPWDAKRKNRQARPLTTRPSSS
jgi:hypothetical protein